MSRGKPREAYIRVRLSKAEYSRLEEMAEKQRRSKSEVVRIALDDMYENKKES